MKIMIFTNEPSNYKEYDNAEFKETDRFYIVNGISYLKESYKLEECNGYTKLTQTSVF